MNREGSKHVVEPDHPESLLELARHRQSEGDIPAALDAIERALALNPAFAEAYGVLGELKLEQGSPEEALAEVKKGMDLGPAHASLHNALGRVLQAMGRQDEARDACEQAIALAPEDASIHYNAALNLLLLRDRDGALKQLEQAVALDPSLARAHFELGVLFEKQKEYQAAVLAYQRAIRLTPADPEPHRCLGQLLWWLDKLDEAQVCYENVLRINPEDPDGLLGLADVYRAKELPDKAMPLYRRAAGLGNATAAHFLAALSGQTTATAPSAYVKELFDGYADEFEEHLRDELYYRAPEALYELFARTVPMQDTLARGLDMGCGTGLGGLAFGKLVSRLDGVDLSPDMIERARDKGVYSELHVADVVDFINTAPHRYDLFVSSDALIYLGDLEPLFRAMREHVAERALVAFSLENSRGSVDYELCPSGRFAHSAAYITALAKTHRFEVLAISFEPLRKEGEEWVEGALYILRALPRDGVVTDAGVSQSD